MFSRSGILGSRMRILIAGLVVALLISIAYHISTFLWRDASFQATEPNSCQSSPSSCTEVLWASESILLATASNNRIEAFDVIRGHWLWSREFDMGVAAYTCHSNHVYVMLDTMFGSEDAEPLRRLDLTTGEDTTPKGVPKPSRIRSLVWSTELDALCTVAGDEVWVYSSDLMSVARRIPYDIQYPEVTSDGKSLLLAQRNGSCTKIDLQTGNTEHLHGPPATPNSGRSMLAMDAPFLSNAFHSTDGPLIRIIDNSWATGQIFFHSTLKGAPIEKDSKNGHAVAAVHWPSGQLAVSGTEQNLLLFSTTGQRVAQRRRATSERTYSIAFSPSGEKIATLGQDGSIRVFRTRYGIARSKAG